MSTMTRRVRSFSALFALLALLFAQIALASYACPTAGDCGGMPLDSQQPALCHAHGQQGDQSLDKPSAPLPDPVATTPVPALPGTLLDPLILIAPSPLQSLLSRATAPPLALRHCCLRI